MEYSVCEIESVECIGNYEDEYVYDIEMDIPEEDTLLDKATFFANDILIHNSVYISFEEVMNKLRVEQDFDKRKKLSKALIEFVLKEIDSYNEVTSPERYNAKNMIFWDNELLADAAIYCKKKKYCAHMIEQDGFACDKMLVKGLEIIRSSTPKRCRDKIKEAVSLMLQGKSEEEVNDYCYDFYKEFKKWDYSDYALPKTAKELNKWECEDFQFKKGTPQHYKGAVAHNQILRDKGLVDIQEIKKGDKCKMLHLDPKINPYHIGCIAYMSELPKEFGISTSGIIVKKHFELGFVNPVKVLYEAMGWKLKDYTFRKENILDLFE